MRIKNDLLRGDDLLRSLEFRFRVPCDRCFILGLFLIISQVLNLRYKTVDHRVCIGYCIWATCRQTLLYAFSFEHMVLLKEKRVFDVFSLGIVHLCGLSLMSVVRAQSTPICEYRWLARSAIFPTEFEVHDCYNSGIAQVKLIRWKFSQFLRHIFDFIVRIIVCGLVQVSSSSSRDDLILIERGD